MQSDVNPELMMSFMSLMADFLRVHLVVASITERKQALGMYYCAHATINGRKHTPAMAKVRECVRFYPHAGQGRPDADSAGVLFLPSPPPLSLCLCLSLCLSVSASVSRSMSLCLCLCLSLPLFLSLSLSHTQLK